MREVSLSIWCVALGAAILGALHVVGSKLRFISYVPRSGWLSFAGGISVAYVFVHLLPELSAGAEIVERELGDAYASDHVVWLVSLAGMVLFYGLEIGSRTSRGQERGERSTTRGIYALSIGSYALYNAVIAYVLHERAQQGAAAFTFFVIAMAVHFLVNDFSLREHHKRRYKASGRWILVGAIAGGAVLGSILRITPLVLELTTAVIAGGVILNVLKEELPTEAESRFSAFVLGVALYALLLLAV